MYRKEFILVSTSLMQYWTVYFNKQKVIIKICVFYSLNKKIGHSNSR